VTLSSANNSYSGATTVNGGTLRVTGSVFPSSGVSVNGGTFEAPVSQKVKTLTVAPAGTALLTAVTGQTNVLTVGDGTSATSPFNVGSGSSFGKVDINSNGLIVDVAAGGETSALTGIRNAAQSAYNGGTWTGNGLTSSSITTANKLAIGYALPADATAITNGGTFYGSPADASSVVVRTTVQGDSNLDGIVNFTDLLSVARNYNASNTFWSKGDFDYNGLVNFTDLLILARNYNLSTPSASDVPGASPAFEADMTAAFAAAVPEPTSIGLLGLAGAALLGGRRRRRAE
jgi:autotransporter-associated beta strand protein